MINHVAEEEPWASHHTPAMYGFQSYISMPILLADGRLFGTLCAIDPKPAKLNTPEVIGMFKLFAELIAFHLEAGQKLEQSESALKLEQGQSDLREQFIAVLGHDLRNPLASIDAGVRVLLRSPQDEKSSTVLSLMRGSVRRMAGLIDNLMDFARGRLGGGLPLTRVAGALQPVLSQVVDELAAGAPDRRIETHFALTEAVLCDTARIGQLLSNLLANALTHGAKDQPIRVEATTAGGTFTLSIANGGEPIPAAAMERLFQPFFRGEVRGSAQGLGLGLYIAAEIARAHGGTLDVSSTAEETRLTLTMPVAG